MSSNRMWGAVKRDPLKWVSAAGAIVATASAEYAIARAIGMHELVACAVPVALDAYVLRALAAHREVLTAVLAMIGVNAGSHLVTAGVLEVGWQLITAVSAIAPLVLWRVHALGTPRDWRVRKIGGLSKDEHAAVRDTSTEHERVPDEHDVPDVREHPSTPDEHVPAGPVTSEWDRDWLPDFLETAVRDTRDVLDTVTVPSTPLWITDTVEHIGATETHENKTRVLTLVPPLPDTFTPTGTHEHNAEHVRTGRLHPSDTASMDRARELYHTLGSVPGVRAMKTHVGTGTDRARRLCSAVLHEHDTSTGGTP